MANIITVKVTRQGIPVTLSTAAKTEESMVRMVKAFFTNEDILPKNVTIDDLKNFLSRCDNVKGLTIKEEASKSPDKTWVIATIRPAFLAAQALWDYKPQYLPVKKQYDNRRDTLADLVDYQSGNDTTTTNTPAAIVDTTLPVDPAWG